MRNLERTSTPAFSKPSISQMQRCLDAVNYKCVPSVVPTLKTNDSLRAFRQPIDQLPLAFIAPLGAHHNDIATFGCFHFKPDSSI